MYKRKIGILLLGIISLLSCKNEFGNQQEIVFGDCTNMNVDFYDTILIGQYHEPLSLLDIDVNKDNIADIQILSDIWGSPGLGMHARTQIRCLRKNVELQGYYKTDTLFFNKSTSIVDGSDNSKIIYEYKNYSCYRMSDSDSIIEVNQNMFKIASNNKGDSFSNNSIFKSDTIMLFEDMNIFTSLDEEQLDANTIKRTGHRYYNDCNRFPLDEITYIGFKIKSDKRESLGWVKVIQVAENKIYILESAIQKTNIRR